LFLKVRYRRFPVVTNGRLDGLISRYDVLRALDALW
jgi:CBS domain-containing protein